MHVVVFEDDAYRNLLPLVYWRATFELRCGRDSLPAKMGHAYAGASFGASVRGESREVVRQRVKLTSAEERLFLEIPALARAVERRPGPSPQSNRRVP